MLAVKRSLSYTRSSHSPTDSDIHNRIYTLSVKFVLCCADHENVSTILPYENILARLLAVSQHSSRLNQITILPIRFRLIIFLIPCILIPLPTPTFSSPLVKLIQHLLRNPIQQFFGINP